MRKLFLYLLIIPVFALAAAPDDIEKSSQRAWYDAVDIDGDSDKVIINIGDLNSNQRACAYIEVEIE